jgi:hypothetical protein
LALEDLRRAADLCVRMNPSSRMTTNALIRRYRRQRGQRGQREE